MIQIHMISICKWRAYLFSNSVAFMVVLKDCIILFYYPEAFLQFCMANTVLTSI
jgi:hypothetical protein